MTKDEFHARLGEFLKRRPFSPFVVELLDGHKLVVKELPVVFSDGAASFIDPEDGALVDFYHEDVQAFGLFQHGAPA